MAPILSSDEGVAEAGLNAGFVAMVEGASALSQLTDVLRVSLETSMRIQAASLVASAVTEGAPKPIGRLDFELAGDPTKVAATIVVSAEALRSFDQNTQEAIMRVLVQASAAAADAQLVAALVAAAGSAEASADPGVLLSAISGGNPSSPAILGTYADLLAFEAGVLRDLRDLGVAIIPTPAAEGYVIAVDQSSLAIAADDGRVEVGRHAMLAMTDDGAGTPSYSLSQRNLTALRSERMMRFAIPASSVAYGSTA